VEKVDEKSQSEEGPKKKQIENEQAFGFHLKFFSNN
jgi:hypothetical protein